METVITYPLIFIPIFWGGILIIWYIFYYINKKDRKAYFPNIEDASYISYGKYGLYDYCNRIKCTCSRKKECCEDAMKAYHEGRKHGI